MNIIGAALDCLDYMKNAAEKKAAPREEAGAAQEAGGRTQPARAKEAASEAAWLLGSARRATSTRAEQGWKGLGIPTSILSSFSEEEMAAHKSIFDAFDMDGGGTIDRQELACLASALGIEPCPNLLEKIDQDGDGLLSIL